MNDHIEELIVAYLHRGSTPEQERELFEACRANPDTASLLRQHLIMSLKLRQLRDRIEVPEELHSSVIGAINEISSQPAKSREDRRGLLAVRFRAPRFGWSHLAGASLATAAAAIVFALIIPRSGPEFSPDRAAMLKAVHDTVQTARVDTVFQTREIRTPVYIVRNQTRDESSPGLETPSLPQQPSDGAAITEDLARQPVEQPSVEIPVDDNQKAASPAIAEAKAPEQLSYMQQYNAMVLSLEKVRLTSNDRVRN
jgi:hypothetical protein